ncbi:hypothetical protein [Penaeicola halotolerans]|uniref:hypothetical protein n=1 Tax=Penaeicola halotolerans TaxID=2793196 RepID=UPI001CF92C1B|nr:hypothetical protein [Penaeicola halotolerans]
MNGNEYYWFKLINYWVNVRYKNGLSIPFILGARTLIDNKYKINEKSVSELLYDIKNSEAEDIITIQHCADIGEYVLGINDRKNPKIGDYIKNEKTGETRIIRAINTNVLGKSFDDLIESLTRRYTNSLSYNLISRNDFNWTTFTDYDLEIINNVFNR